MKNTVLQKLINLIQKYKSEEQETDQVVLFTSPQDLQKKLNLTLSDNGSTIQDLFSTLEDYLEFSVRTAHPQFFNQLWAGFSLPAFLGEVITALTNTSMYTYEMAPVATLMEKYILEKMLQFAGFNNGEGQFVTGGSNANLVALMVARNSIADIKNKGIAVQCHSPLVLFVSNQAHYSFLKAVNILGIGMEHIIEIPSDDSGKMIPQALNTAIIQAKKEKKTPFFVGATAGTTVLGAFDPLSEISAVCKKHNLWLHVDGAMGGSTILSREHKHLLKGLENTDSFTWDAHKMMGLPLICSVVLFRKNGLMHKHLSNKTNNYIFHEHDHCHYDLGPSSLQCGRKVDVLKLWLHWQYFGNIGLENRVNKLFELAHYAKTYVEKSNIFTLVQQPESVNVCFRVMVNTAENSCKVHTIIRERLLKQGKSMVNFANINGKKAFRLVIMNPEISSQDIDQFFRNLEEVCVTFIE